MSSNLTETGRDLSFPGSLWLPQISVGLSSSQSTADTGFTTANTVFQRRAEFLTDSNESSTSHNMVQTSYPLPIWSTLL